MRNEDGSEDFWVFPDGMSEEDKRAFLANWHQQRSDELTAKALNTALPPSYITADTPKV